MANANLGGLANSASAELKNICAPALKLAARKEGSGGMCPMEGDEK
jgi:hypothetical protein